MSYFCVLIFHLPAFLCPLSYLLRAREREIMCLDFLIAAGFIERWLRKLLAILLWRRQILTGAGGGRRGETVVGPIICKPDNIRSYKMTSTPFVDHRDVLSAAEWQGRWRRTGGGGESRWRVSVFLKFWLVFVEKRLQPSERSLVQCSLFRNFLSPIEIGLRTHSLT